MQSSSRVSWNSMKTQEMTILWLISLLELEVKFILSNIWFSITANVSRKFLQAMTLKDVEAKIFSDCYSIRYFQWVFIFSTLSWRKKFPVSSFVIRLWDSISEFIPFQSSLIRKIFLFPLQVRKSSLPLVQSF